MSDVDKENVMLDPMADIRAAISAEMKRRKWSTYRLVQELKGKRIDGKDVPSMTVYQFIEGTSINTSDLSLILQVLDLEIKRKK